MANSEQRRIRDDRSTCRNDPVDPPLTFPRSSMLVTLRFPLSSALRLNIAVGDTHDQEQHFESTLTAVELAGRLSSATKKPISPEAVAGYCAAWRAATEALAELARTRGRVGLARLVRQVSSDRALWAPRTNTGALKWLQCILECHYLSRTDTESGTLKHGPTAGADHHSDLELGRLCEDNFAHAYALWLASEVSGAPFEEDVSRRLCPANSE